MIDAATRFRKSSRQVSCQIDDEIAILDMDKSLYFRLEGVAVEVWGALDQPSSVAQLRDGIVARFDVTPEACEADLVALLGQLQAQGLVEIVS